MQKLSSVSARISERTRSAYCGLHSFCEEIIQWRRPVMSSYYLLVTNAAFWGCVFYLEQSQQLLCLIAIASVIFVTSILSTAVVATAGIVPNTQRSYDKWFAAQGKDELVQQGSVVSTLLKPVCVIAFTLESFFLPMFSFTFSLLFQRPASFAVMTGSSVAAYYLQMQQQEKACWTAYLTVLLTILIPPWRYNCVTEQITALLVSAFEKTSSWLRLNIFGPIFRFIRSVFLVVRYCVCGYWIPPLVAKVTDISSRIWSSIRRNVLDPVGCFLTYLKRGFIYWACGYWIPPLVEYLQEKKRLLFDWIDRRIVQPVVAAYNRVLRFCVYWFGGYWIAPFRQYCADKRDECIMAFRQYIVDPIIAFFSDFKNNMKYILFGHWIPPFTAWFHRRVIEPIIRALVKIYRTADYVFCGRWIPGMVAYLRQKALDARVYTEDCLRRFRAYVICCVIRARDYVVHCAVRTRDYCRDLAIRTAKYIRTNVVVPFIQWVRVTRIRLRLWFINNVLKPAWEATKEQWRRFKYYVKHHVLYPALRRAAYFLISGLMYAWQKAVVPVVAVASEYGARGKDYAYVNWVEPAMEWLARNLPEKSPFVDDSDTELKDFLPSEEEEEEEEVTTEADDESVADEEEAEKATPGTSATVVVQPAGGAPEAVRLKLPARAVRALMSPHIGSSSEEEDEFSVGLNFPAVENADSDEEEEKSMVPRKLSSASSSSSQRFQKRRRLSGSSGTSSTARTRSPANASAATKLKAEAASPRPLATNVQNPGKTLDRVLAELEPDFEMIDHNEVDD